MLRISTLILALFVGWTQSANSNVADLVKKTTPAEVVAITDGDTVVVLIPPSRRVSVRLFGIDAPESGEPFSRQAQTFTRVLMFSKMVQVIGQDVDRYGRLVARVAVDGLDASARILAAGLACHFRQYSKDPLLEAAEQTARKSGLGFWAPGAQRPACVAKGIESQPSQPAEAGALIGNVSSLVYHLPTCRNANCKNCTRKFRSRTEAEAAGFRAAGDCHKPDPASPK